MAASNINRVVITGNLTADPELRSLPSGTSVCKLRVAVQHPPQGRRDRRVGRQAQLLRRHRLGRPGRELRPLPRQGPRRRDRRPPRVARVGERGRATSAPPSTSSPTPVQFLGGRDDAAAAAAAASPRAPTSRSTRATSPRRAAPAAAAPARRPTTTSRSSEASHLHDGQPPRDATCPRWRRPSARATLATGARASSAVAALTVALATDLIGRGRRGVGRLERPRRALAQARRTACPRTGAGRRGREAFGDALAALEQAAFAPSGASPRGDAELGSALDLNVQILLGIGAAAGDRVQSWPALSPAHGEPTVRADAVAASMLAVTAAEIATHLIEVNLLIRSEDDRAGRRAAAL